MPLITLSLEAGRTAEEKRQLADAVYEALRAAIQIPENDRFVAIREHAAGDLVADPGYLGVPRSGHPVFVEISLRRGRPAEKKQALYRVFTNTMSGQQPRGAAFLDRKAASGFVPAANTFCENALPRDCPADGRDRAGAGRGPADCAPRERHGGLVVRQWGGAIRRTRTDGAGPE